LLEKSGHACYPGLASHPFTWEDAVQKFDALVAGRIDNSLSGEIKNAVRSMENIRVRDLIKLLGYVRQASSAVGSETSGLATSTVTTTAD
jgi:2-methylcitrate dehydratase